MAHENTGAVKRGVADDLAEVNSTTLHLLKGHPDLFDLAALSALTALQEMVLLHRGAGVMSQMLSAIGVP